MAAGGQMRGDQRGETILACEIRPGVVWIRPGPRPYTRTDVILSISILAMLELTIGYWIATMTASRIYGVAAMGILLLIILISARIVLHRSIRRSARLMRQARTIIKGAIEGDPAADDAMLCGAIFTLRRAHLQDVSSIRLKDLEKLEHRLSRRLPRVWLIGSEPMWIASGFAPSETNFGDSHVPRYGLIAYEQGEQVWRHSPVISQGDSVREAGLLLLLGWLLLLPFMVLLVILVPQAPAVAIMIALALIVGGVWWLSRMSPVRNLLKVTPRTAKLARRGFAGRTRRERELCPEDLLVLIRDSSVIIPAGLRRSHPHATPLGLWRFTADRPSATTPQSIEVLGFDPQNSPWHWVADQSWAEQDDPNAIGL